MTTSTVQTCDYCGRTGDLRKPETVDGWGQVSYGVAWGLGILKDACMTCLLKLDQPTEGAPS
jgi:hypothetical protein